MRGGSHGTGPNGARRGVRALMVGAVVVAAACGPNPGVTDPPPEPVPTAGQAVWALGDSQAGAMAARGEGWGDRLGPAVFNAAWRSTGAGFVTPGTATGRTVVEDAAWYLAHHDAPERLLVIAGVNDLGSGRSVTEMLDAVDDLEQVAADHGVEVWYVGYPPFVEGSYLQPHLVDRLTFNAALEARFGDRVQSCDDELLADDGVWLDDRFRLSQADEVHLGDEGLDELAECVADRFGAPLEAP